MKFNPAALGFSIVLFTNGYVEAAPGNPVSVSLMKAYVSKVSDKLEERLTLKAGTSISIVDNVISGAYNGSNGVTITGSEVKLTPVTVGQVIHGCTVYWVDSTEQHGLCVSTKAAANPVAALFASSSASTEAVVIRGQAYGYGIGSGAQNTAYWLAVMGAAITDDSNILDNAIGIVTKESVFEDGSDCPFPERAPDKCYSGFHLPSRVEANLLWESGQIDSTLSNCGADQRMMWTSSTLRGNTRWVWAQATYLGQRHISIENDKDTRCVYPVKQF